jgi:drug/metabolite transporter (DMT)-like permease
MRSQTLRDYAELHFIVFIWGFTAILGVLISTSPTVLVMWRTLLAGFLLGLLLLFKKTDLTLPVADLVKLFGTGVIIAFHWIFFFQAARISNVSVCLAGLSTVSLWTSFMEPMINRRPFKKTEIILGFTVIIGIYAIFYFQGNYWLGLLVAIFSALLSALFSVINARLVKRIEAYKITFYEMWAAFFTTLVYFAFQVVWGQEQWANASVSSMDLLWLSILAFLCTVYPFAASTELMKRLSAFTVNLTVNLEPVYGIVMAMVFFGENKALSLGFYAGTAIVLGSVIAHPFLTNRKAANAA